ncbi:MAG: F0F1 ATP synthase subunit A [Bdellovibrionales bacterium]|nr:F0F1 ATP synthase subunit A [Bdellovibrionales bacterium]
MEAHYTYLDHVIPQLSGSRVVEFAADHQKAITAIVVALLFVIVGKLLVQQRVESKLSEDIIPSKKVTFFGLLDFFMESFISYHDSVAGRHNRKYVPFCASIFFFIFFLNLLGLVPGMPAATTTVWLNVAMAIVVFIYFNVEGIKEHGFVNYLKHFAGPVWWIAPALFCIEIFGLFLRILTLNLRLYWNITADHLVLGIFTDMLPVIVAAPFYILGVFVSFMQAFVFATLTMVYIVMATQHEEAH